jgi:two-component system phosphate regulon response regulator PhoB
VLFRYSDLGAFERLVGGAVATDLELDAPGVDAVEDGEWLLAVFELGPHRRATSVAARAVVSPESTRILLEPRDCVRLSEFARLEASRPPPAGDAPEAASIGDRSTTPSPPPLLDGDANEAPRTERSVTPSAPPPGVAPVPPARAPFPSGAGARVMVVDDDEDIREMVAAMLEAVGLLVTPVGSAEEALARFKTERIDLLVLDWNMPRMTGLDLCKMLRSKPGLAALPVLFLTANTSSSDMVEAFAAGADDYVVKPFRAPELGARIFSLLRRARLTRENAS